MTENLFAQLERYGEDFLAGTREIEVGEVTDSPSRDRSSREVLVGGGVIGGTGSTVSLAPGWVAAAIAGVLVLLFFGVQLLRSEQTVNPADSTTNTTTAPEPSTTVNPTKSSVEPAPLGEIVEGLEPLGPLTIEQVTDGSDQLPHHGISATSEGFVGTSNDMFNQDSSLFERGLVSTDGVNWSVVQTPRNGTLSWVGDRYWLTQGPSIYHSVDLQTWEQIDTSNVPPAQRILSDPFEVAGQIVSLTVNNGPRGAVLIDPRGNTSSFFDLPFGFRDGSGSGSYTLDDRLYFVGVTPEGEAAQYSTSDLTTWDGPTTLDFLPNPDRIHSLSAEAHEGVVSIWAWYDGGGTPWRSYYSTDRQSWEEILPATRDGFAAHAYGDWFYHWPGERFIFLSKDGRAWQQIEFDSITSPDGDTVLWNDRSSISPQFNATEDALFLTAQGPSGWSNLWKITFNDRP
jgi:hypothetical protein